MFTFKNGKKVLQFVMWNNFPSFLTCIFLSFFASSLLKNSHILRSVRWPPTEPRTVTHARDHWWTLDFANAFVSPGVNSREELVPSPRPSHLWAHFTIIFHIYHHIIITDTDCSCGTIVTITQIMHQVHDSNLSIECDIQCVPKYIAFQIPINDTYKLFGCSQLLWVIYLFI
jgi:hypothetical protein